MSVWLSIKAGARTARATAEREVGDGASLDAVLAAALASLKVEAEPIAASDPLLGGGEARLDCESFDDPVVWYPADAPPERRRFLLAHELAHAALHTGSFTCLPAMIDPAEGEDDVPVTEAYSPRERRERQANVWAREFLLPAPVLRERHLTGRVRARDLALELGLDERLVRRQMARALLTVEPAELSPQPGAVPILEGAQKAAAEAKTGPVLVIAGPGTGKTTTLAARIGWLLDRDVDPEDIAAVTFSRRAAEEMRSRVAAHRPGEAERLRIDTVHSFCLNLLRRYGPWPDADVIDEARATGVVEGLLPRLGLRHLLYLPDPGSRVRDALRAVGRAKDDLVTPEAFGERAAADLEAAWEAYDTEHARPRPRRTRVAELEADLTRAEKVVEVGRVYQAYQRVLRHHRRYDFGDLVAEAVRLLISTPDLLREVADRHLLVDEFQDLNAAAVQLVRLLAGSGRGLWAVGDPHQAIYRFQGASPAGLLSVRDDYPGTVVVTLDDNRRSRQEIVDVVSALVPTMRAAPDPSVRWTARRGAGGAVELLTAESPEAELDGLARAIRDQARTTPYREQAVLARKHTHLAEIADALERADVPVLFLAGFFERGVVRDLLAVLELVSEPSGRALLRVASFPEYAVPRADALALLAAAAEAGSRFPDALSLAATAPGLSTEGRAGLARLQDHLSEIRYGNHPWEAFTHYLFNASAYLDRFPADDAQADRPHQNQRRRAALFQLLQLASTYSLDRPSPADRKRTFLAYVRRLAGSNQHRQFAQPPAWATPIDAVRLLTAHGAKGLEFDAIYVPRLNEHDFYSGYQGGRRPLVPSGVLSSDPRDDHEAEEECLHFVALSRTRDRLVLSRSRLRRNWSGDIRRSSPSPPLVRVRRALPARLDAPPTWLGAPTVEPPPDVDPITAPPTVSVADLEAYAECPRRYAYERLDGVAGHVETTPYQRLVATVRQIIRDLTETRRGGSVVDPDATVGRWHGAWDDLGNPDDPYDALYRSEGEARVRRALRHLDDTGDVLSTELSLRQPKGTVTAEADLVLRDPSGLVRVQRWTAGAPGYREKARPVYTVLHQAARETWGGRVRIEAVAVAVEDVTVVPPPDDGLALIDRALDGLHRNDFPARPDEYRCPSCPFYFLCPS